MNDKKPLIVLTGPTAVGKTELSIALAEKIGGSIISADSMQVYRHMDIGSAKIKKEEMRGIPHYLIDILEPEEDFNVVTFKQLADAAIKEIYSQGRIPIIAGGTGFYIQAVLNGIDFSGEDDDRNIRNELEEIGKTDPDSLYERLLIIDPESAAVIHKNNVKRVIRAIEYFEQTGEKISVHNARERLKDSAYNSAYFVLELPRDILYERIEKRVDSMLFEGLIEEVTSLKQRGLDRSHTSMQGLGYKEVLDYLSGEISLTEAVYRIKRDTRHFAKRQITWFKREKECLLIDKSKYNNEDEMLVYIMSILKEKNII